MTMTRFHVFHNAASCRNQSLGHGFTRIFTDFYFFHLCLSVQSVS